MSEVTVSVSDITVPFSNVIIISLDSLQEELENPMNVHRWRKLEGSDPATFELVQKIQILQKRLIEKSEEVVDKDLLIHRKDRLYAELKVVCISSSFSLV